MIYRKIEPKGPRVRVAGVRKGGGAGEAVPKYLDHEPSDHQTSPRGGLGRHIQDSGPSQGLIAPSLEGPRGPSLRAL
jgi:hypothetical protein